MHLNRTQRIDIFEPPVMKRTWEACKRAPSNDRSPDIGPVRRGREFLSFLTCKPILLSMDPTSSWEPAQLTVDQG
jgi:hypothetical protein